MDRKEESETNTDDWYFDEVPPQIAARAWNKKWIPFAYDGSGGYLYIDFDPTVEGTMGQVIQTTHDGECRLVAPGYREFLNTYLKHLHLGLFELNEEYLEHKSGDNHWWDYFK